MNTAPKRYLPSDGLLGQLVAEFGQELASRGLCLMLGHAASAADGQILMQERGDGFTVPVRTRPARAVARSTARGIAYVPIAPAIAARLSGAHEHVQSAADTGETFCVSAPGNTAAPTAAPTALAQTLELLKRIRAVLDDDPLGPGVRVLPVPPSLALRHGEVLIERPTPDGRLLWPYRPTDIPSRTKKVPPADAQTMSGLRLATGVWAGIVGTRGASPHLASAGLLPRVFDPKTPHGALAPSGANRWAAVEWAVLFLTALAGRRVVARVLVSTSENANGRPHGNDAELAVVQVDGRAVFRVDTGDGDLAEMTLGSGDLLLLPRNVRHAVTASQRPGSHRSARATFAFLDDDVTDTRL